MSDSTVSPNITLADYEDISGEFTTQPSVRSTPLSPTSSIATMDAPDNDTKPQLPAVNEVDTDTETETETDTHTHTNTHTVESDDEKDGGADGGMGTDTIASILLLGGLALAGFAAYLKLTGTPMSMQHPWSHSDYF